MSWVRVLLTLIFFIIMGVTMKITTFIKESYAELKKVIWPSKNDVISQTVVVVVSLVFVSAALALVDFCALKLISTIISF